MIYKVKIKHKAFWDMIYYNTPVNSCDIVEICDKSLYPNNLGSSKIRQLFKKGHAAKHSTLYFTQHSPRFGEFIKIYNLGKCKVVLPEYIEKL